MLIAQKTGTYSAVVIVGLLGGLLDPLGGLLGGSSGSGSSSTTAKPTAAQWRQMGSTSSKWKRVLRAGCHNYTYNFTVKPPASAGTEWSLETFLIGPRGGHLASDVILGGADAKHGQKVWRLCKSSTVPGRFTISSKLTYNESPDQFHGWVKPSHFRLTKP